MQRLRVFFGIAMIIGSLVLALGGLARAQGITGDGCTATVNGRTPSELTEDAPLVVKKGDSVALQGSVPPQFANPQGRSTTTAKVLTPFWMPDVSFGPYRGKGNAWGSTIKVPDIVFTLSSGVYKIEGQATGTGGWRCAGSAYVQIGDAPVAEAVLGGLLIGGGAAAVRSGKGRKADKSPEDEQRVRDRVGKGAASPLVKAIKSIIRDARRDGVTDLAAIAAMIILVLLIVLFGLGPFDSAAMLPLGVAGFAAAAAAQDVVWVRGRPVRGFLGGLIMGLGLALVLHAFGVWPLSDGGFTIFPVANAVVWGIRGARGRPYKVEVAVPAPEDTD